MPKRIFYDGGGERKLVYKCDTCRRLHDTHEDAVACEHGHVKMLAFEQVYDEPGAAYPVEVHAAFADGTVIHYQV